MSDSQTLQWQALSRDHHLPPFTDYKALNAKGTRVITRADGSTSGTAKATRSSTPWPGSGA